MKSCNIILLITLYDYIASLNVYRVGQKSKLLYCDRYFKGYTIVLTLNILSCMFQDLKVGNTDSICVVKCSILHTFMTSCSRPLVRVCLAVISLTTFSHRIFKHKTIVT